MKKTREILVILGMQGYGKSVFAKQQVRRIRRSLIYDPMAEYDGEDFTGRPVELVNHARDNAVWRLKTADPGEANVLAACAFNVGRCTVVIEEASIVLDPHEELTPEFKNIVFRGRHPEVSIILVTQRAHTVHIAIRSQWTRLVSFNQTEDNDVKALIRSTGFNQFQAVQTLPKFEYIEIERGRAPVRKRLVVPKSYQ